VGCRRRASSLTHRQSPAALALVPDGWPSPWRHLRRADPFVGGAVVAALSLVLSLRGIELHRRRPHGSSRTVPNHHLDHLADGAYRIDVENPSPGSRPGQMHFQDTSGPDLQCHTTFVTGGSRAADSVAKRLATNPDSSVHPKGPEDLGYCHGGQRQDASARGRTDLYRVNPPGSARLAFVAVVDEGWGARARRRMAVVGRCGRSYPAPSASRSTGDEAAVNGSASRTTTFHPSI